MSDLAKRPLLRSTERGEPDNATHPWNPAAEVHGWTLSRATGLTRIAVNLLWLPPGKEAFAYHCHHHEEEWLYVLDGHGVALVDGAEQPVGPGDFLGFAPGVAHLLRNTGVRELRYLAGGEQVEVDVADFPVLDRRVVRLGEQLSAHVLSAQVPFLPGGAPVSPRPQPRVLVAAAQRGEPTHFRHPDNPNAEVHLSALSRPAGLKRVAVVHSRVPAGRDAFAYHVHQHDEEWMFVLSGRGVVELGDEVHEIGPGDFVGFTPRGVAHNSRALATSELVCVQGGDAWSRSTIEVIDFPRLGLRRTMVGTRDVKTFALGSAK